MWNDILKLPVEVRVSVSMNWTLCHSYMNLIVASIKFIMPEKELSWRISHLDLSSLHLAER